MRWAKVGRWTCSQHASYILARSPPGLVFIAIICPQIIKSIDQSNSSTKLTTPAMMSTTKLLLLSMIVAAANASWLRALAPIPSNVAAGNLQSSCNPTPQVQDGTDFLDLSDKTLLIRNVASNRYIYTPDNDSNGRKHSVGDLNLDYTEIFFAAHYNGESNGNPNVQFNLKQVTCPRVNDPCASQSNCYTIESLSTGESGTVWRVYADDAGSSPCAQVDQPTSTCAVNFQTWFGIQSQNEGSEVGDGMKWQFISEGDSYYIVNAANGRRLYAQEWGNPGLIFGAAFKESSTSSDQLWDLVPVVPTDLEAFGYEYQGRGYCINASGQTYNFHRITNVLSIEECAVRCRDADVVGNQDGLLGVNYHPDVNGGNCNCMMKSDANSGEVVGVKDYSDAKELCYSFVGLPDPADGEVSSVDSNSCNQCKYICQISFEGEAEYNECISQVWCGC